MPRRSIALAFVAIFVTGYAPASMADEPSFPSADDAKAHRAAYRSSAERAPEPTPRRVVVARVEPPADEDAKVKLTPEEMRALLAVQTTPETSKARTLWHRSRIVVVPVALVSIAIEHFFGAAGHVFVFVATIGGLLWIARPLFKRDGWS